MIHFQTFAAIGNLAQKPTQHHNCITAPIIITENLYKQGAWEHSTITLLTRYAGPGHKHKAKIPRGAPVLVQGRLATIDGKITLDSVVFRQADLLDEQRNSLNAKEKQE